MKNSIKKITAVAMAFSLIGANAMAATPFVATENTVSAAQTDYTPRTAVTTAKTPVYNGVGKTNKVLYTINKGTQVGILDVRYNWARVSDANGGQWIPLDVLDTNATVKFKPYVAFILFNDTPVLDFWGNPVPKAASLSKNTQIAILNTRKVIIDGQKKYIAQISTDVITGGLWVPLSNTYR